MSSPDHLSQRASLSAQLAAWPAPRVAAWAWVYVAWAGRNQTVRAHRPLWPRSARASPCRARRRTRCDTLRSCGSCTCVAKGSDVGDCGQARVRRPTRREPEGRPEPQRVLGYRSGGWPQGHLAAREGMRVERAAARGALPLDGIARHRRGSRGRARDRARARGRRLRQALAWMPVACRGRHLGRRGWLVRKGSWAFGRRRRRRQRPRR
jgi:hypothetical protein